MYNSDSRTKNSIKNMMYTVGGQFLKELLSFAVRTVFVYTLAAEYLGVNGLFLNIISFLSLAEMGVGSALIFSMYKPMAEHDEEKIQMYMAVYRKVYLAIGFFVLAVGIGLTPFLDFFMKERPNIPHLEWIYILYVINTGATYFFAYKGSIFQADQRAYVVTNNATLFTIIQSVVRIVVLLTTYNFILYLSLSIAVVYLQNLNIAHKANKVYPFVKVHPKNKLPEGEMKTLKKNIWALMMHKIGAVVLSSSDNLIISKFISVIAVGLYSNYSMVVIAIRSTYDLVIGAVGTSIGHLCSTEGEEKTCEVHNSILMLTIWIAGFCAICLCNLLSHFVSIWLGESFLLDQGTVLAITIAFYIQCSMRSCELFKDGSGLFYNDRFAPLLQCVVNVIVSIALVFKYGMMGIFIGTSIAMLTTKFWISPHVLYKNKFRKPLRHYFVKYALFTIPVVLGWLLTFFLIGLLPASGIGFFVAKVAICAVVPNLIFVLFYFRMKEFRYCVNLLLRGRIPSFLDRLMK